MKTFTCWECGNCCRFSGYVRLETEDLVRLAAHHAMEPGAFTTLHTDLTRDRRGLTLKERADGSCIYLDANGACTVYEARPKQCREFPYQWNYPGWESRCDNQCALPGPSDRAHTIQTEKEKQTDHEEIR